MSEGLTGLMNAILPVPDVEMFRIDIKHIALAPPASSKSAQWLECVYHVIDDTGGVIGHEFEFTIDELPGLVHTIMALHQQQQIAVDIAKWAAVPE